MDRLIRLSNKFCLMLLRKKFGLKKYQYFKFNNQKSKVDRYYFTDSCIMKFNGTNIHKASRVRIDFLTSKNPHVKVLDEYVVM